MPSQSLARGLFLAIVAAAFGLTAMRYPIGELSRFGPGLFPLIVSGLLGVLAIVTLIQSRVERAEPLYFSAKNIALIMCALLGFVVLSKLLDMAVAIVFLVFVASFAGTSSKLKRNLQISAGLIAIAFVFERFLSLNLGLF